LRNLNNNNLNSNNNLSQNLFYIIIKILKKTQKIQQKTLIIILNCNNSKIAALKNKLQIKIIII